MNEDINNTSINNNEEFPKKIQPQPTSAPTGEIDKQKLLLKIQRAQMALATTNSEFEDSKAKIDGLSEHEKRKLEQRLDDLQALVHFGRFKVSERERQGEQINPEEKNLEALKEAVDFKAGEVHKWRWSEEQYITPQLQQVDESLNSARDTIDEIDSHIRK